MRLVVLLAAVFFSLASAAVGYRQSYRDQDLGRGRHLITTTANEYNQSGDAHQFAFQRAKEVCPDGFDVLSQDGQAVAHDYHGNDSNPFLAIAGSSEKHEVSLVVQCLAPEAARSNEGAELAAKLAPKAVEAAPAAAAEPAAEAAAPPATVSPVTP
jgi:hypothetical protein